MMNDDMFARSATLISVLCAACVLGLAATFPSFNQNSSYNDILAARGDSLLAFTIPAAIFSWTAGLVCVLILMGCLVARRSFGVSIQLMAAILLSVISGALLLWRV